MRIIGSCMKTCILRFWKWDSLDLCCMWCGIVHWTRNQLPAGQITVISGRTHCLPFIPTWPTCAILLPLTPQEINEAAGRTHITQIRLSRVQFADLQNWVWTQTAPRVQVQGVENGQFGQTCTWTWGSEVGWEIILVPFAKFSWNNTTSPSEPQVCQVCTWTSAEPQGPGSARGWTKPTGPGSGLDKKCPNLYSTEPQTV